MGEVVSLPGLLTLRAQWKFFRRKVVFTNGCFDILHRGHIEYLSKAKALGDVLIVGLNDDASVTRLKGPARPVVGQEDRAQILAALRSVDFVCVFSEDTPYELIKAVVPDVLVKGADWPIDKVVGKDIVEAAGGEVQTIEFLPNRSSSRLIDKISATARK
ncbi:MAG TPA: D-glycero-beta-D-manno-heptose 1-phosphate adenylyltransferase [Bacteroidota bacterium]